MAKVAHDLTDAQWAALREAWGGCAYCGSDEPRKVLTEHGDLKELFAKWRNQCDEFREYRKQFLLY